MIVLKGVLGLNYGSIDLALDRQGRHVFFEINCAGQYKWMEEGIAGLELSLELTRLLAGQTEPMVPGQAGALTGGRVGAPGRS